MKLSYNDLLLNILSVIDYQDSENFVKRMEQRNRLEALGNCIEKLTQSARDDIIASSYDQEVVGKYITKDIYTEELNTVSTKALADFLQYMTPYLNDKQKEQIAAAFPQ